MKSAIITPDHASIELPIPESYIGKKVEVTYTIEEVTTSSDRKKASDFKGILSKERALELQEDVKESRQGWKNRI